MSLSRDTVSNFIGGVSQQTDKLMYPNQSKVLENFLLDPIEGLKRRPPSQTICKLCEKENYHPYIHTIIKEDGEYQVLLSGNDLKVFNLKGELQQLFNIDSALDYIQTENPLNDLFAVTIADYTFILNKTKKTTLLPDTFINPYNASALIFVKQGDYGVTYKVIVDGIEVASVKADESEVSKIWTDYIAKQLKTKIDEKLGTETWKTEIVGSTILLQKLDGSDFTIQTSDGNGDRNLYTFYKEASALTDLPVVAPDKFVLKIIGDSSSNSDDYYIQFKTNDGSEFGTGAWIECCQPNLKYKIDPSTMPHALIREEDGTFSFKPLDWTERKAGDEDTCPTPSFIGNTIQEVLTYKGRLGFISADRSCYSDVADLFSFFKRSALTELDTDPIDVGSNSKMVNLKHSLPFNEGLLLFSETSQFTLKGGDLFSNSTVSLDLSTEYQCSKKCKPINTGSKGFFTFENGNYTRIMATYVTQSYTLDADDITEQVPSYLPSNVYKIVGSSANNILLVLSENEPNNIYVYNFYFNGEERVQSAWHKWCFKDCKILNIDFDKHILYLTTQYEDGIYLEKIDLSPRLSEVNLDYLFYLDKKVYFDNLTYNEETNKTELELPYVIDNKDEYLLLNEKGFPKSFEIEDNKIIVKGQHTALTLGKPYKSFWKLSNIYVRQNTQSGGLKVREGILMLRDINLTYANSGHFKVDITSKYTTQMDSTFTFTGKICGQPSATIGTVPIESGTFLIPIISRNEDIEISIKSESYLPCCFLSLEWLGEFTIRGK